MVLESTAWTQQLEGILCTRLEADHQVTLPALHFLVKPAHRWNVETLEAANLLSLSAQCFTETLVMFIWTRQRDVAPFANQLRTAAAGNDFIQPFDSRSTSIIEQCPQAGDSSGHVPVFLKTFLDVYVEGYKKYSRRDWKTYSEC